MQIDNLIENPNAQLINIDLRTKESEVRIENIDYFDEYSTKINGEVLNIVYTRHVIFSPEPSFNLKISFKISWIIKNDKLKELTKKISSLNKDDVNILIGPCPSEASLLISQIFKSADFSPLITPPVFIEKDKKLNKE